MTEALAIFAGITLPVLGAAVVVGLVISVLQAATQIQDQTFPQTAKILTVLAVVGLAAGALTAPLVAYTEAIFSGFAFAVR